MGLLLHGWMVAALGLVCSPNLGWLMGLGAGAVWLCGGGSPAFCPHLCLMYLL